MLYIAKAIRNGNNIIISLGFYSSVFSGLLEMRSLNVSRNESSNVSGTSLLPLVVSFRHSRQQSSILQQEVRSE